MIVTKHKHLLKAQVAEQHISRAGRALLVLWAHFNVWKVLAAGSYISDLEARYIATKTKALIKHDRILRGEA